MSITSSSLLFLLLCIAISPCHARPIGVVNKDNEMAKSSHFPNKNEEESSPARVSISSNKKPSKPNKSEAAQEDESTVMDDRLNKNNIQGTKAESLSEKKNVDIPVKYDKNHKTPKVGSDDNHAVQTESLATISWKVPQRKRGEQQPGFNLDYEPPKTHPPVHN